MIPLPESFPEIDVHALDVGDVVGILVESEPDPTDPVHRWRPAAWTVVGTTGAVQIDHASGMPTRSRAYYAIPPRPASSWPDRDTCSECGERVRLAVVDRAAESASGWAIGDPVYVHEDPTDPDNPELCTVDTLETASTSLRDTGEPTPELHPECLRFGYVQDGRCCGHADQESNP